MSDENENLPSWRKKFLATRMAMESILFEKELMQPKKEKLSTGLLVAGAIWLFNALLLAQWSLRRGSFFGPADAESFGGILRYAAYFKVQTFWALVKPDISAVSFDPPLYALAYVPVFNFVTTDLNLALILVNSVFLLVLALAVFLAARENRPNATGWYASAFALALPFVAEAARRPSPDIALLAFAAAAYACFMRSEEFSISGWTFACAVCLGLGFYSHRYFWIYALPLAPYVLSGLSNPASRDELFKGFFPAVVLNLPWYVFAAAVAASGMLPLRGEYFGFLHYFRLGMASAGLPLFVIGAAALAWMYFSVFMAYPHKKIAAAWFWVPYLVLAWGLCGTRPDLLAPAMLPFAIAAAIMTPHQVRKFFMAFVLLLAAVNQSGLVGPLPAGASYPFLGLPSPSAAAGRAGEIEGLVKAALPPSGGMAAVFGDASFNSMTLRYGAAGASAGVKYSDNPACPACASVLVHKTPPFGAAPGADSQFAAVSRQDWFPELFSREKELQLGDSSKVEIYVRRASSVPAISEGSHGIRGLAFGPLKIEEATLNLSGYNEATGAYDKARLFAPAAELLGGDIYGLSLDISGLRAAGGSLKPFVPSGMRSVKVRSAKIAPYAVESYLAQRYPFLTDIEVKMENGVQVTCRARGRRLFAAFLPSVKDGGAIEIQPLVFTFGPVTLSHYLLKLFTFRLDFRDNPYGIAVGSMKIEDGMLEIY